jgi:mitochondrial cardiolipin hydrolase
MKRIDLILSSVFLSSTVFAKANFRESVFQPVEIKSIDSCFSPIEKCDIKIISFIGLAKSQLDIAIFSLTHAGIASAIKKSNEQGVAIRMIVDREQALTENSKIPDLKGSGISIKYGVAKSMMHNKFTIVDLAQLETGSYNYTFNATNNNLENQIYISDESVVKNYSQEFERMWGAAESE